MSAVVNDSAERLPGPERSFSGELSQVSETGASELPRELRGISSGRREGMFGRQWSKGRVGWSDMVYHRGSALSRPSKKADGEPARRLQRQKGSEEGEGEGSWMRKEGEES